MRLTSTLFQALAHIDWTVSNLTHPYPAFVEILDEIVAGASADEKRKLYRDTAIRSYRLAA